MKKLFSLYTVFSLTITAFAATTSNFYNSSKTSKNSSSNLKLSYTVDRTIAKNCCIDLLPCNNIRIPSSTTYTSTQSYDSITANYLSGDTKEAAKKFSAEYIDLVLKAAYKVNHLTSEIADNQEIKYTVEDESGIATALVTYQFRANDFTIQIKSLNYFRKGNKTTIVVSKDSNLEATRNFYNLMKDYLITRHANYITPGSAK